MDWAARGVVFGEVVIAREGRQNPHSSRSFMKLPLTLARLITLFTFAALATMTTPQAFAEKKPVAVGKTWKGEVQNDDLLKDVPNCLTSAAALAKLWKDWKIAGEPPTVDFAKQIVVVVTTKGSMIRPDFRLDEKGNLESVGMATMDFLPGFRYVLVAVDREGIKTIDGKELAK